MRALIYYRTGAPEVVLKLADLPDPALGPGEVMVSIAASGINPHDTKRRAGWTGEAVPACGLIPHSDGAGVIRAVGDGVDPQRVGERVWVLNACPGTAADLCVVPAENALPLPDGFSMIEGAALGVPALTAWLLVLGDGPIHGQTLVIQGGGGAVGRVAVELACAEGAYVVATGRSARSRAVARAKGADMVTATGSADTAAAVDDATKGRGADRLIEVDFAANQSEDLHLLAPHGTLAAYSSSTDRTPVLDYYAFAKKALTLRFVQGSDPTSAELSSAAHTLAGHFGAGRLRPDIAMTFAIDDAVAGHCAVERGADGNVVVTL